MKTLTCGGEWEEEGMNGWPKESEEVGETPWYPCRMESVSWNCRLCLVMSFSHGRKMLALGSEPWWRGVLCWWFWDYESCLGNRLLLVFPVS